MQAWHSVFPQDAFTPLGFILLLPLLGALVNGIFGKRLGRQAVTLTALLAVGGSFVMSLFAFGALYGLQTGDAAERLHYGAWTWLEISRRDGSSIPIEVAFSLDALSGTMALIVTGVGFLIHLYSTKYMEEDPGYHRFFCYLNLFIFSMLVLILGDNLPVLFVGWEGVGLCSYLLIGFWFEAGANAAAGKKAFITNRIGDFGLLVAMGLLLYYVGRLDWTGLETVAGDLVTPVKVWPIGNYVPVAEYLPGTWAEFLNTPRYVNGATLVGLALFLGCAGKSAQIPLYVWLPDAMAGPTPVSALIHAATMVTAGVYLVCRMSMVFVLSPAAMFTVALVGALTALFAATIALVQNDIKKVLAYSTVSQLGYMFLGVGVGAFVAGFFHVLTHAFFKACLFLGAGSVIHAMHARIHGTDASQDMRNMGGLRRFMPVTYATFVMAWAAIVGFPLTSGFFSKDEILLKAQTSHITSPVSGGVLAPGTSRQTELVLWPEWGPGLLYALGTAAAVLTAFYMTRLVIGTFFGEFRGWTIVRKYRAPAAAHHGHDHHEEPGPHLKGPKPHESPWQMTLPLVVLGVLSLFGGFLSAHVLHIHPLDDWLDPVFRAASSNVALTEGHEDQVYPLLGVAMVVFLLGAGAAYWVYLLKGGEPALALRERFPRLYALVYDKWRIDELYEETVLGAVESLAEFSVWFDKWVVDGILARLTSFVIVAVGTVLRYAQVGRVQAYAAVMVLGLVGFGAFVVQPRVQADVTSDHAAGKYALSAAPGLGYRYRWDVDGDGSWDSEKFDGEREHTFELAVDQTRTVKVEVMNAFGATAMREYSFTRPKPDLSGPGAMRRIDVERAPDGTLRGRSRQPRGAPGADEPAADDMGGAP